MTNRHTAWLWWVGAIAACSILAGWDGRGADAGPHLKPVGGGGGSDRVLRVGDTMSGGLIFDLGAGNNQPTATALTTTATQGMTIGTRAGAVTDALALWNCQTATACSQLLTLFATSAARLVLRGVEQGTASTGLRLEQAAGRTIELYADSGTTYLSATNNGGPLNLGISRIDCGTGFTQTCGSTNSGWVQRNNSNLASACGRVALATVTTTSVWNTIITANSVIAGHIQASGSFQDVGATNFTKTAGEGFNLYVTTAASAPTPHFFYCVTN